MTFMRRKSSNKKSMRIAAKWWPRLGRGKLQRRRRRTVPCPRILRSCCQEGWTLQVIQAPTLRHQGLLVPPQFIQFSEPPYCLSPTAGELRDHLSYPRHRISLRLGPRCSLYHHSPSWLSLLQPPPPRWPPSHFRTLWELPPGGTSPRRYFLT